MHVRSADYYEIPSLYDIIHSRWTAQEFAGVERVAERFLGKGRGGECWFEPACGTGRYLVLAARRGGERRRVAGLDSSEPMLAYARRRFERAGLARRATLTLGDMTDFDRSVLPREARRRGADLAFNLINTVRHLMTDRAMLAHFACVAEVLRPGGVYVVGVGLARYYAEFPAEDVWEGARGRCRVRQVIQYTPPLTPEQVRGRRERVVSHITATRPRGTEEVEYSYWLRTYSPGEWDRLIGRSALRIVGVMDVGGAPLVAEPAGYGLWVLARR
jgi:SAM-dependent methyltransferase